MAIIIKQYIIKNLSIRRTYRLTRALATQSVEINKWLAQQGLASVWELPAMDKVSLCLMNRLVRTRMLGGEGCLEAILI
jgi:hypothetical protein